MWVVVTGLGEESVPNVTLQRAYKSKSSSPYVVFHPFFVDVGKRWQLGWWCWWWEKWLYVIIMMMLPQFDPSSCPLHVPSPYRPPRPGRQPARQRPWGRTFGHHEPAHCGADGADQTRLGARPDGRLLLMGGDGPGEHRLLRVGKGEHSF